MKIYLDVLFISNLLISMLTLSVFSRLIHLKLSKRRYMTASVFSGFSSLIMLIEPKGFVFSLGITLIKLALSAAVLLIAVRYECIASFLSRWAVFITVNVIFGGICFLLWDSFGGETIIIKNYTVYLNVPIHLMLLCTAAAYVLICIYDRVMTVRLGKMGSYKAVFTYGSRSIVMPAVCDTGNTLTDSFSGEPVVIFLSRRLYEHFQLGTEKCFSDGFHLIPYSTVDGSRLIPVTLKGEVYIRLSDGTVKHIRCAAGILDSSGSDRAIFNPILIL